MHREIAINDFRVDFRNKTREAVWSSELRSSEVRRLYMMPFYLSPGAPINFGSRHRQVGAVRSGPVRMVMSFGVGVFSCGEARIARDGGGDGDGDGLQLCK